MCQLVKRVMENGSSVSRALVPSAKCSLKLQNLMKAEREATVNVVAAIAVGDEVDFPFPQSP